MSKWFSLVLTSLLLALALAACGGGDDDADPTSTATTGAQEPAATSTATLPATGGDAAASPSAAASPTAEAATPTVVGTAPSRPIVTPTQPAATATAMEGSGFSELETEMLAALLQPEDFSSDWTQDAFGLMEPDNDDSDELCGLPPFPDRDQRIAGVEAEYSLNSDTPAFMLENIVIFPNETAVEALAYARQMSTCGEWTDAEGQTYTIQEIDGPVYGDESFTASMAFETQGTPFYGEYAFIRVGGAIATVAFITIEGSDVTPYQALVGVAADRLIEAAANSQAVGSELSDLLLTGEDVALVDDVNVWETGNEIDPTDEERFSVCAAASFPDVLGSVNESGHELNANDDTGPYAMHSVVQMLEGDGAATMDWIRTELSCPSWTDEDGEYVVTDSGDLDVGDDTYWLIVTLTADDGSGVTAQVGFGFTQLGDYISVVGLAAEGSIDPELFGAMIALGAEMVSAGTS
ncbi:MAG TPA: hypothetical protein VEX37_05900 [Thermomicrobiales bacterium]|nr:hypothetical protein [Thermomicrobiales bacterium]